MLSYGDISYGDGLIGFTILGHKELDKNYNLIRNTDANFSPFLSQEK